MYLALGVMKALIFSHRYRLSDTRMWSGISTEYQGIFPRYFRSVYLYPPYFLSCNLTFTITFNGGRRKQ